MFCFQFQSIYIDSRSWMFNDLLRVYCMANLCVAILTMVLPDPKCHPPWGYPCSSCQDCYPYSWWRLEASFDPGKGKFGFKWRQKIGSHKSPLQKMCAFGSTSTVATCNLCIVVYLQCIYICGVYLYYSVLICKLQSNFIKLRSPILEVLQRNQVKYNNTL